jgi:methyl-accepting chemotaxis protein
MISLGNTPIHVKAFLAPLVLLACMMIVCFQGLVALGSTTKAVEHLSSVDLPKRAAIETMAAELAKTQLLLFRYVSWLTAGVDKASLDKLQAQIVDQNRQLADDLEGLLSRGQLTESEKAALTEAKSKVRKYFDLSKTTIDMGSIQESMATMMLGQADEQMNEIEASVSAMVESATRNSQALTETLVSGGQESQRRLLTIAGMAGVIGVAIAILITMSIVGPLRDITRIMRGLTERRRETINPSYVTRKDEIGDIAQAVAMFQKSNDENTRLEEAAARQRQLSEDERRQNHDALQGAVESERTLVTNSIGYALRQLADMDLRYRMNEPIPEAYAKLRDDFNAAIAQLDGALQTVDGSTHAIHEGSQGIAAASDDLSRRTEHQAASLEETAAALAEVTNMMKHAAESATQAQAIVVKASADADRSGAIMERALESMNAIEMSSRQIGQIIGVIDEIAFQTNLLALNAGVEAARAGDAGRGFAVVASEVRALAQRSAESAKEIKSLVSGSAARVEEGVELVRATGVALKAIRDQVAEINCSVSEIRTGAREQASALVEINTAISEMDIVTQRNASMVEESTAASASLNQETSQLTELLGAFRLSNRQDAHVPLRRAG